MPRQKRRLTNLICKITGLDENTVFGLSVDEIEAFIGDYDEYELDLSCEEDFSGIPLNDDDVNLLIRGLTRNFCVQSLLLWGNKDITESSANALKKILAENTTLTDVNLDLTGISDKSKRDIQQLLLDHRISRVQKFPLRMLDVCDLSRANLNDASVLRVKTILKTNTDLTSLLLWGNPDLSNLGARELITTIKAAPNFKHINLDFTGVDQRLKLELEQIVNRHRFQKQIFLAQENDPQFSVLDLSSAGLAGLEMAQLTETLTTNTTITKLVLSKNPEVNTEHMTRLFSALPKTNIIHLEADWNRFDAEVVGLFKAALFSMAKNSLIQQNENLTTINLSGIELSNEDVYLLLSAVQINSTLQSLNLARNPQISDEIAACLHDVVRTHPVLSKINLSATSCTARMKAHTREVIKQRRLALALAAMSSNEIEVASLRNLDLNDDDLAPIMLAISTCTSLHTLDISGNKALTNRGLETLIATIDSVL